VYNRNPSLGPTWQPALDVCETADAYLIKIEVPGVPTEAIVVDLVDNVLSISGEKRRPYEANSTRMHRLERGYGPFERKVQLPDDIDPNRIEANLEQGVLTLRVDKRHDAPAIRIPVKRRAEAEP
jgi:HSP20 family protein